MCNAKDGLWVDRCTDDGGGVLPPAALEDSFVCCLTIKKIGRWWRAC